MGWLLKLPAWRGTLTLAYHRIHDGPSELNPGVFSATPETFDAQMSLLARHFDVVSPEVLEREPDAGGRRVMVTFDDGYRDNFRLAFPILRRHGIRAIFFLTTGLLDSPSVPWWEELAWMVNRSPRERIDGRPWIDRSIPIRNGREGAIEALTSTYKTLPDDRSEAYLDHFAAATGSGRCDPALGADLWMTWQMAAELRDAGMVVGGHTVSHPVLARCDAARQEREVRDCAARLLAELGVELRYFAYPVGLRHAFDATTRDVLARAGIRLAFSLYGGYLRPRRLDRYDVPRTSVGMGAGRSAFRAALAHPRRFARW
jgi:peptidoglycan/xylan/chitin deacetylase (PgdA/CDA1 family)